MTLNKYKLVKNTEWKEVEANDESFEVPMEWDLSSVENTIENIPHTNASKIKSSQILPKGAFPVVSQEAEFVAGYCNSDTCIQASKESPVILFGDHTCILKLITFDFIVGADGAKVFKSNLNPYYAFYSLKHLNFKSTGYNRHFKLLKEEIIRVPPPSHQTAISSILSHQESIINDTKSLISKYESRFQYLSEELLSGRLRVKEVDGEIIVYKNAEDNWQTVEVNGDEVEIPKDWEVSSLEDLASQNKVSLSRGVVMAKSKLSNTGFPVYSSSVKNNGLMGYSSSYTLDQELISWSVDGGGNFFYRPKHKFTVTNVSGYLIVNSEDIMVKHLCYSLQLQHSRQTYDYTYKAHPSVIVNNYYFARGSIIDQQNISRVLSGLLDDIHILTKSLALENKKFDWLLDNLLSGKYLVEEIAER